MVFDNENPKNLEVNLMRQENRAIAVANNISRTNPLTSNLNDFKVSSSAASKINLTGISRTDARKMTPTGGSDQQIDSHENPKNRRSLNAMSSNLPTIQTGEINNSFDEGLVMTVRSRKSGGESQTGSYDNLPPPPKYSNETVTLEKIDGQIYTSDTSLATFTLE